MKTMYLTIRVDYNTDIKITDEEVMDTLDIRVASTNKNVVITGGEVCGLNEE